MYGDGDASFKYSDHGLSSPGYELLDKGARRGTPTKEASWRQGGGEGEVRASISPVG